MENPSQKAAFLEYEADAWFERNLPYIERYNANDDRVISLLEEYTVKPGSVLELGCSAGHRLNGVLSKFKDCKVYGVEPSARAIEYGRAKFPGVELKKGTADNLSHLADGSVDIVILGFLLYVVDRSLLFRTIAEIDRVLANHGLLVLVDFFSESPVKNEYRYINQFPAYSFKQNYDEIFTSSKIYYLLDKCTIDHNTRRPDASEDYYNKFSISLLKKDVVASYK